jgi:transposase-like protein
MKDDIFGFTPHMKQTATPNESFEQLEATELYCPKCAQAVPVRKSLLLILPSGDKYEYRCQLCGSTVGDKIDRSGQFYGVLKG